MNRTTVLRIIGLLFASLWSFGCAHSSAAPSSATEPATQPAPTETASARPEDLLGPERRLRMPIEGLPCEGPEDALVTVVEYVGYQCPFTRRHEATVRRILAEHPGEILFCVKHLPIPADQPHGVLAAYAALEAFEQGGAPAFFRLHRAMLDRELDDATIFVLARDAGMDEARLSASLEARRYDAVLQEHRESLFRLDRSGTPQLFVAGRNVPGAKPYEELAPIVEDAIVEARRLVAAGVRAADLYEVVQRGAIELVERQQSRPGEPARVRIRFIDVATSRHPLATEPRTEAEALALAEELATKIRNGDDFHELARRYSAASNAARGGEFGWIARGTLMVDVEDVAFRLAVGEVGLSVGSDGMAVRVVQRLE